MLFREVQGFERPFMKVALALPPLALLIVTCRQVIWHRPWGNPPTSNAGLIFLTGLLLSVYFRLITVRLVTELRASELTMGLNGLWRRRRVGLAEICSVKAVDYDAAKEFGGYGIRSSSRGQAYIAHGNHAVQLGLANGSAILLGSQQAPELVNQIEFAMLGTRQKV